MSARLYVGNISYTMDEHRLAEIFSEAGFTVSRSNIVLDKETGRSKGFGFVDVNTDQEAKDAIAAMNSTVVDGRTIRVDRAVERPRPAREQRDRG